jgi:hypothetical protein
MSRRSRRRYLILAILFGVLYMIPAFVIFELPPGALTSPQKVALNLVLALPMLWLSAHFFSRYRRYSDE